MYVYMYVCMYVYMPISPYVHSIYACMKFSVDVCIHVFAFVACIFVRSMLNMQVCILK